MMRAAVPDGLADAVRAGDESTTGDPMPAFLSGPGPRPTPTPAC